MTSATDTAALSPDDQYRLVYAGIWAVAANCDGAREQDGVGFNGQDTKFGKRIASVDYDMWTDDVKVEAARIALTYKAQILAYTGLDISTLDVVREANDLQGAKRKSALTNHDARDQARQFERRAEAADQRVITLSPEGLRAIWFKFPFDAEIKDAVKAAGARWNGQDKVWWIPQGPVTPEVAAIAAKWFRVLSCAEQFFTAPAAAPVAPAKPAVHGYMISDQIVFDFPYNPGQKDAIKAAGARWNGADKTWRVKASDPKAPAVVAAARQVGLVVATEVESALGGAVKAASVKLDRKATLVGASRLSRPQDVSPEFLALVAAAVA
jgi:hypothetical protein